MAYRFAEYHATSTPWRQHDYKPKGELVGIELEMEHPIHRSALLNCIPEFTPTTRPITERDSSLDSTGVEIIFPPVSPRDLIKKRSAFSRTLTALAAAGATPSSDTGMHINVNTGDWTGDEVRAFTVMFNAMPARWLDNVGGRLPNDYCGQAEFEWWHEVDEDTSDHCAAAIKHNRVELRFPSATTNMTRVSNILLFIRHVHRYAKQNQRRLKRWVGDCDHDDDFWDRPEPNDWYDTCEKITEHFESWMGSLRTKSSVKIYKIMKGELDGDA